MSICRVLQDFDVSPAAVGSREPGQMYCSSPSNQSTSSDPGPCVSWGQKGSYEGYVLQNTEHHKVPNHGSAFSKALQYFCFPCPSKYFHTVE